MVGQSLKVNDFMLIFEPFVYSMNDEVQMIRIVFGLIMLVHGLIHLMGFVKAFEFAEISQLTSFISRSRGMLWLLVALLFTAAVIVFVLKQDGWWMMALPAVVLSQILIILAWQDAKFGMIANGIILIACVLAYGQWDFNRMVRHELQRFVPQTIETSRTIRKAEITHLPPIVQQWLKTAGIIGQPLTQTVHLHQQGKMRTEPDGPWMKV
ncbi:MAG: hypothetical protein GF313_06085, partial [Caldithrix sp.]|nr:hypothetical protein [Caldithrix sp.]